MARHSRLVRLLRLAEFANEVSFEGLFAAILIELPPSGPGGVGDRALAFQAAADRFGDAQVRVRRPVLFCRTAGGAYIMGGCPPSSGGEGAGPPEKSSHSATGSASQLIVAGPPWKCWLLARPLRFAIVSICPTVGNISSSNQPPVLRDGRGLSACRWTGALARRGKGFGTGAWGSLGAGPAGAAAPAVHSG